MNVEVPVEGETANLYPLKGNVARISGCNNFLSMSLRLVSLELSSLAGLDIIGNDFLAGCRSLRELDLQGLESVRKIGYGFLRDCDQLEQLDVSPLVNVEEVGAAFLMNAKKIAELDLRPMHCVRWNLEQWLEGTPNLNILRIGLTGTASAEVKKALDRQAAAKKRKEPCTVGRKDTTKPLKVKVDAFEHGGDIVSPADWVRLFVALECTEEVDPQKASKWVRGVEKTQDNFERDRWSIVAAAKTMKQEDAERQLILAAAAGEGAELVLNEEEARGRLAIVLLEYASASDLHAARMSEMETTCREQVYSTELFELASLLLAIEEARARNIIEADEAPVELRKIVVATAEALESTARLSIVHEAQHELDVTLFLEQEPRGRYQILSEELSAGSTVAQASVVIAELLWRIAAETEETGAIESLRLQFERERSFVNEWLVHEAAVRAEELAEHNLFDALHGRLRLATNFIYDESASWHKFVSLRLEDLKAVRHAERQRLYTNYFAEMIELSKLIISDDNVETFRSAVTGALP